MGSLHFEGIKEDQMIKKIQKVELQISGNVRVRGDVVTLTAAVK